MSGAIDITGRVARLEERLQKLERADAENRSQIESLLALRDPTPLTAESEPPETASGQPEPPQDLAHDAAQCEPIPAPAQEAPPSKPALALQKLQQTIAEAQRKYDDIVQKTDAKELELKNFEENLHAAKEELARNTVHLRDMEEKLQQNAEQLAKTGTELADLENKVFSVKEDLSRSKTALAAQKQALQEATEDSTRKRAEQASILQQANRDLEQARKAHQGALKEYEALKAKMEQEQRRLESFHLQVKESTAIRERIWPSWMLSPEFARWKSDLEKAVLSPTPPPSTGLLFAAVHSFNAAIRDTDAKTLIDSLRDIGRRLYSWLRDLGLSEEQCADASEEWAKAINQHCAGAAKVDIPRPGNAAEVSWMTFQPRGGSSPDVVSVRNWCVRDSQSRPAHRAEVIV